ncbi:hypothetical protein JCM8115_002527 [Rhodotorula mucilaginosa]
MLSGPSLLPTRPGRTVSSGLPRRTASSSTSKAPPPPVVPAIAVDEQPVASTSKLPPPPSTPAQSECEASRLDWADLLAERSDVDLLNDESATWLLDRSAFTIGARTPAKAFAATRDLQGVPDIAEEDLRPFAEPVVQSVRDTFAGIEDVRLGSEVLAASQTLPSNPSRRRSATPAEQQSAQTTAKSLSPRGRSPSQSELGDKLAERRQEGEEREHEVANQPAVAAPTVLSPQRPTEVHVGAQQRRSHSPVLHRRHRPSLAPLSRSSALPPNPASEPFVQAPQEILPTSSPKEPMSSIPTAIPDLQPARSDTVPVATGAAAPEVPTQKEHATTPATAAPVVSPPTDSIPSDSSERKPTARARLPRASLAVTTAAAAAPALVRPAHILPADHPSHPRLLQSTKALASSASTSSSMKGVRGPDEEAKKKVREAKEARERSARERKEKAEKAATALREAAKRDQGRAKEAASAAAAAAAAVVMQKAAAARKEPAKAMAPLPSLAISNNDPIRALQSTNTAEEAAPAGSSALTTGPTAAPPSLSNGPTEAEDHLAKSGPPMLPPIVIIETEGNSHDEISRQLDPNVTLPDMGAPLDFGLGTSASGNGASVPAARVTSTPAHHPSSQRPEPDTHKVKGSFAALRLMPSVPAAPVTASATDSSAAVPTKRRRPSRAGQLVHSTASSNDGPLAPIENSRTNGASDSGPGPGRSRIVRVTLVAPAPLPRPALHNDATTSNFLPSMPSGPPRLSSSPACEDAQPLAVQSVEAFQPQQDAEARPNVRIRRASRVSSTGDIVRHPGLGTKDTGTTHRERAPAVSAETRPIASKSAAASSAPISSSPSVVRLPPRPRLKPAEIIGGITLPATFSFAEPNEESEAERQRRLLEKERREKAAELVLAEKKRLRESASAWAIRPDETAKRPRLSEPSDSTPAIETRSKWGAAEVNYRPTDSAESAPRLHRPPRRSIAQPQQHQQQAIVIDKEATTETGDAQPQPEPPLALTKEALERNARKAGPRPDLHRRVSRFLEEISEAEEPLEDSALLSRDDEAQVAEAADAVAACVDHAPASAASAPVANVTDATQAGMPAHPSSTAPTSERQPQIASTVTVTTLPAARAHQAKLVGKVTNQSTLVRRARADDEDVARHGAKKPRHDPATATASVVPTKPTSATATTAAAAARPRGKENGAAQYSVAAELEKQLQARLEWSERQKRREEEAKRFRQRQRDEEAAREREKLAQLRSSLNQARRKPAAQGPAGPRKVGRT